MSIKFIFLVFACILISGSANAKERDPESVFNNYCFACHGTGWEDAPVIGDGFAWKERKEKGLDVLLNNTLKGMNSMPPKGSCDDCSDDELRAVINFLVE